MSKRLAEETQFQQLSLPLYLGEPFLTVKTKIRNPEARAIIEQIQAYAQILKILVDSGRIQSSEACLQIRNFLSILGLK